MFDINEYKKIKRVRIEPNINAILILDIRFVIFSLKLVLFFDLK